MRQRLRRRPVAPALVVFKFATAQAN